MRAARIVNRPAFRVAGLCYRGENRHDECKSMWDNDFLPRIGELAGIRVTGEMYGVVRPNLDDPNGVFEYLVGVEVPASAGLPAGMVSWDIPADTYVVVGAEDFSEFAPVHDYIRNEWLPQSAEWERGRNLTIEWYPPNFANPSMAFDICWSIKRKPGA
jgi:predicted transcriptional regulator YdeE